MYHDIGNFECLKKILTANPYKSRSDLVNSTKSNIKKAQA